MRELKIDHEMTFIDKVELRESTRLWFTECDVFPVVFRLENFANVCPLDVTTSIAKGKG